MSSCSFFQFLYFTPCHCCFLSLILLSWLFLWESLNDSCCYIVLRHLLLILLVSCLGALVLFVLFLNIFIVQTPCATHCLIACFVFLFCNVTDAADLLQKLSLDSQTKSLEAHEPPKKVAASICMLCFIEWLPSFSLRYF